MAMPLHLPERRVLTPSHADQRSSPFEIQLDDLTGRTWNVALRGRATGGPLAGTQLDAVPHVDTFWFAWAAFRPDTTVID
jgi:hypothetical protein